VNGGTNGNDITAVLVTILLMEMNYRWATGMLEESSTCTIQSNEINSTSFDGIEVYMSTDNQLLSNIISSCPTGINLINASDGSTVTNNEISSCTQGVHVDGSASFNNNTLTGNTIGIDVTASASGKAVSIGNGNVIAGGNIGVNLDNAEGSGNPVLTFGTSTIKGLRSSAIQLMTGMSTGDVIDINSIVFQDAGGNAITNDFDKEDMVYHVIDAANRGLLWWVAEHAFVTPASGDGALQRAIDAAGDGETIDIKPGTYTGNVNATTPPKDIILNPGASPGCVTINGDLSLNAGDVTIVELDCITMLCPASTLYDHVAVTGNVSLGGATLDLNLNFAPTSGDQFTIIDGANPIAGEFAEGTSITVSYLANNYTFGITYSGSDVVLTYCASGPTAAFAGSTAICSGSTANLTVNFTGASPWDFTYTDGTTPVTVSNVTNPYTLVVGPLTVNTTYTITSVTDGNNCSNTASSSAKVYIGPITTAPDIVDACPGTPIEFPITVKSFSNVGAISMSLNYDNRVMTFNSFTDNSGLIDYCQAVVTGDDGVVRFSGTPDPPAELADDAVLITLNFNYINGNTNLTFDDSQEWCDWGPPDYVPFCYELFRAYYVNGS
jgi:parallel beta-helix repeat protein